jgi:hypothetical protein
MVGFDRLVPPADDEAMRKIVALVLLIPAIAIALAVRARPLAFALCIGAILVGAVLGNRQADTLWRGRSFFGAYRVGDTAEGLRLLYHGTTVHGAQWTDRFRNRRPATYYAEDSPVAGMIGRYRSLIGLDRVGVVGLGVGSLACYRAAGERWRFYEIDPLMVWIAARSGLFSFLTACPLDDPVVVGDGRLSLSNEKGLRFDLLIVDAFTSDAIPIHLLTREAFGVYLDRLGPEGVLLLHVSNRHVDLPPLIAQLSADMGLAARLARKTSERSGFASTASDWIAIARRPETLERLRLGGMWSPLVADDDGRVWTDDYSNIIETIIWW